MARNVTDLALLLSVQAGYDPRSPLSIDGDGMRFRRHFDKHCKGKRIAWGGDLSGAMPCEPGVLKVCETATDTLKDWAAAWTRLTPNSISTHSGARS